MDVILGIDIGGSTTKIVGLRTDGSIISMLRVRAEDQVTSLYGALGNYLTSNGLSLQDVRRVVLTGVKRGGLLGAASFDAATGQHSFAGGTRLDSVFYGTGDVLASALTGALLCGKSPEEATRIAVDFTHEAMVHTLDNGLPLRYGVAFEQAIPGLVRALGL